MMKRIEMGIRVKLILAFLVVSLIPLFVIVYFGSHQGMLLGEKIDQFQTQNEKIATALTAYHKQLQTDRESLLTMLDEFATDNDAAARLQQQITTILDGQETSLSQLITEFQKGNQTIFAEFSDWSRRRTGFFAWLLLLVTLAVGGIAFFLGKKLTRPIVQLTEVARRIARGEIEQQIDVRAKNEIGQLSRAFQAMRRYMNDMAQVANSIAQGNIKEMPAPQSPHDVLGNAFHTMGQYLSAIVKNAHQVANGNFANPIAAKSSDDVLGSAFRTMTTNLIDAIRHIKNEVQKIEQSSDTAAKRSEQDLKMVEDVLSSAEETSSSMMQMQASVEEVSENMKALSVSIEDMVTSIEEMNMAMKHIAANSTGLSESAQETFGVVQEITQAIERLVATSQQAESSSREASESANAGQTSVRAIIEGMGVIQEVVSSSAERIKALGSRSEEIGSITNVIRDIADQTSLLALNASIIAAQAGEHGRGFAVVAQEVKELATRSSNAAKEIDQLIKGVQTESQQAVQSMVEGRQAVEHGVVLANRGGETLERILASVEKALESIADNTRIAHEQAAFSEQVRAYMEKVVTMVNEIARATDEQRQGAAQITNAVGNMRDLAEQVKRATTEQTRGTHHVLEAMDSVTLRVQESSTRAQEMTKFSAELAKETRGLVELLSQFNIGDHERAIARNAPQNLAASPADRADTSA